MVRSLDATYTNALEKVALDRDLSHHLSSSRNEHTRDVAWRLARCADDHNIWFIRDQEHGWLHGRFWKCSHKLCSFCLSAESRRRRRQLLDAIEALPDRRRRWHFVTFTIENPAATIITTRRIVNDSWQLLRKRRVFAEVRACCKSEEFTVTKVGFHYHIHTLIDHDRIDYKTWRVNWTECVERSGGQSTNLFGYQTSDGMLIVNVKPVRNPRDLVNELGKYITKSTSFRDLSPDTINEIAAVKRWNRMFELLGDLRQPKPREPRKEPSGSIVHTKSLKDGSKTDRWWFDKKRLDTRLFMWDFLENKFGGKLYDLTEMRDAITSGNCDITAA